MKLAELFLYLNKFQITIESNGRLFYPTVECDGLQLIVINGKFDKARTSNLYFHYKDAMFTTDMHISLDTEIENILLFYDGRKFRVLLKLLKNRMHVEVFNELLKFFDIYFQHGIQNYKFVKITDLI